MHECYLHFLETGFSVQRDFIGVGHSAPNTGVLSNSCRRRRRRRP